MKPAPAFQCYAANIIANKRYRLMTPYERFVWISIYLECWPNHSVPANSKELAKYLRYSVKDVKKGLTSRVLSFFKECNGELTSPELEEYRETLRLLNLKKSEGGKKGAKRKRSIASFRLSNAEGIPKGTLKGKPKGSLIQSKLIQSNQNQSIEKDLVPANDPFIEEYENYECDHRKSSKGY